MTESTRPTQPPAEFASHAIAELLYGDCQREQARLKQLINTWGVDPTAIIIEGPVEISVASMLSQWQRELLKLEVLSLRLVEVSITAYQTQTIGPLYITPGVL